MGKKKIFKDDGVTEDFDAEALEPDEGTDTSVSDEALKDTGFLGQGDTPAEVSDDAAKDAEEPAKEPAKEPAESAPSEASPSTPEADEVPKFTDAHPETQTIVDAAPDVMDLLKEAGNKLAPAIHKFQDLEAKFHVLEDEAKARLQHLRQKATEAVAALEAVFKRG